MLQVYLASVVVWLVILFCMIVVCAEKIEENGWLESDSRTSATHPYVFFVAVCAIPVFRLFMCVATLIMASNTPEKWAEIKKGYWEDK